MMHINTEEHKRSIQPVKGFMLLVLPVRQSMLYHVINYMHKKDLGSFEATNLLITGFNMGIEQHDN